MLREDLGCITLLRYLYSVNIFIVYGLIVYRVVISVLEVLFYSVLSSWDSWEKIDRVKSLLAVRWNSYWLYNSGHSSRRGLREEV